jgi:hypothetical protein
VESNEGLFRMFSESMETRQNVSSFRSLRLRLSLSRCTAVFFASP